MSSDSESVAELARVPTIPGSALNSGEFSGELSEFQTSMPADFSDKITRLLEQAASCQAKCHYTQASHFFEQALALQEATCGPESDAVACTLNDLAELYRQMGRFRDAQPLYERALS